MEVVIVYYDERGNEITRTTPVTPGEHVAVPLDAMYFEIEEVAL